MAVSAVLGNFLGDLCRSWASAGGPGPLLEPMLAVSNRSWDLCRRSWAALGAFAGDLGQLLGPVLAALGCLGAFVGVQYNRVGRVSNGN